MTAQVSATKIQGMRYCLRTLLLILVAACGGCASPNDVRQAKPATFALSEKASVAHAQLLREIPVGTDMAAAGDRLEAIDFKVKRKSADDYFARIDRSAGFLVAVSWLVSIEGEGGKLQKLTVEVAYTGP